MKKMILRSMLVGIAAMLITSCSTVGETPEVIVILPESEMAGDAGKIDFAKQIKPLLVGKCLPCHHPGSEVTDISFASLEGMLKASRNRPILVPGKPEKSTLFLVTVLPDYFIEAMPASGHKLTEEEKWNLYHWILQGADWPKSEAGLNKPREPKEELKIVDRGNENSFLVERGIER